MTKTKAQTKAHLMTWTIAVTVGTVAILTALASGTHIVHAAKAAGITGPAPYLAPFILDGGMLAATLALLGGADRTRTNVALCWAMLATGAGLSVTANVMAAPSVGAIILSAPLPLLLLVGVEILARHITAAAGIKAPARRRKATARKAPARVRTLTVA